MDRFFCMCLRQVVPDFWGRWKKIVLEVCLMWKLKDITWWKITPRFLTVDLEARVIPSNPLTISSDEVSLVLEVFESNYKHGNEVYLLEYCTLIYYAELLVGYETVSVSKTPWNQWNRRKTTARINKKINTKKPLKVEISPLPPLNIKLLGKLSHISYSSQRQTK